MTEQPLTLLAAGRAERFALRVMQIGAVAVVLVATTLNVFELDRFFVPKELVLHVTATLAGLFALRAISRLTVTRTDLLLIGFLALSALSAVFATNHWLAMRALAISASGFVLFWAARGLREAGLARPLLSALAFAVVVAAITSLLQTYGINLIFFSDNRAPGGTLGNRNFIAHVAAFGLPLLLLAALRGHKTSSIGVAIVTATLVLTRSRAAWLAFAAVLAVFVLAMLFSGPLRRSGRVWGRLLLILIVAGGGVGAALIFPNTLRWNSDNPYLDTVQRVADYQEGSGRGRLVQYERSLGMAIRHPLFGVGPGNWSVEYPAHAGRNDPSISDSDSGMTTNPWPSSDWVAAISERGFAAAILLALAFISIALSGLRQLFAARDPEESLVAAALLGTVGGAVISGLFDAVLLLAVPCFLVWSALGVLWNVEPRFQAGPAPSVFRPAVFVAIAIAVLGAVRSASQVVGMQMFASNGDRASLSRAAEIDPGNYRLRLRLARIGGKQRCRHARAAHNLFPHAQAAAAAARGCSE